MQLDGLRCAEWEGEQHTSQCNYGEKEPLSTSQETVAFFGENGYNKKAEIVRFQLSKAEMRAKRYAGGRALCGRAP
jgi:hypothetical protein